MTRKPPIDHFVEVRNFMKLYSTTPEKVRSDWFMTFTDPARNKRGTVYSQQWIDKALTIMKLK